MSAATRHQPIRLTRAFAIRACLAIALAAALTAALVSRLVTERMLAHDSVLTAGFIRALARAEGAERYFERGERHGAALGAFFTRLAEMPHVLRVNVYARDRTLIWSSDHTLAGRRFGDDNDELEKALAGELVSHTGWSDDHVKAEHERLASGPTGFIEDYVPIRDKREERVLGVVELYRTPDVLFATLASAERLIWTGAVLAAASLFGALFWVVLRADRTMREQHAALARAQALAVTGQLAQALAHSVRNPLAAIRSSADLTRATAATEPREAVVSSMDDIITSTDRIDRLVTDLLVFATPDGRDDAGGRRVELDVLLDEALAAFAPELSRRGVVVIRDIAPDLPPVDGNPRLLAQALASVFANATEAMPRGGELRVAARPTHHRRLVQLDVADSGVGMSPAEVARAFEPFASAKPKGLGIGLALVKRIVESSNGRVHLHSRPGQGTDVQLVLPAVRDVMGVCRSEEAA